MVAGASQLLIGTRVGIHSPRNGRHSSTSARGIMPAATRLLRMPSSGLSGVAREIERSQAERIRYTEVQSQGFEMGCSALVVPYASYTEILRFKPAFRS